MNELAADRTNAGKRGLNHDDEIPYWRRGRPETNRRAEGIGDAVTWNNAQAEAPKYRYLTSIELVTAICVAAVGLSKLAGRDKPTPEKVEDLKTPDELESKEAPAEKDRSEEQSQWANLERDLKDSAWISENAQGTPLARVKNEVVVCSLDGNLNFSSFSEAVFAHWGYRQQELIGRNIIGLVKGEDVHTTLEALRELVANKTGLAFENWIRHKNGNWMAMSWSAYWSDEDNRVIAIAKDITAQKEVERRRQEAVQMVSHDLRSPLTSIQFSLELLAQGANGALSEGALEDVRIAQNNTTQLINLVNDLLDLEKIEHGMLRMNLEKVDLSEVLQSAVDSIRFLARSRRIEIELPTCNLDVFADKDRLVQVLVNILSNAIKFSPDNSTIAVDCQSNETWAEVKVVDQGPGIPSTYKESIFERFKQIEGREGVGQKGAGLGLAICKSIIDGHKGQIGVESGQGQGSTFWFRIPLFEKRTAKSPFGKIVRNLGFRAQAGS
jgi:PAS domain S-box-containing protein